MKFIDVWLLSACSVGAVLRRVCLCAPQQDPDHVRGCISGDAAKLPFQHPSMAVQPGQQVLGDRSQGKVTMHACTSDMDLIMFCDVQQIVDLCMD